MSHVTTVGIDLAKHVFWVHGVDSRGREVLRRTVRREQLLPLAAQWPPCLIGLEACSGAHEWARQFTALGHTAADRAEIRCPVSQERQERRQRRRGDL